MRERSIEVNGTNLRLFEGGEGETVLYLHGAGGANWYPLLEMLAQKHRVIAPEHPGFGRSKIPDWMMSVGDLAYFYLDFLDALDLDRVHLAGHSLGGWTGAEIAIRNTARIKSLSLLAPAGVRSPQVPFGDIFLWTPEEHARRSFHDRRLIEERIKQLGQIDVDVQLQNRAAAARLGWSPRLNNPQLPYWLHRIDRPTLFVWGKDDQICPLACAEPYMKPIRNAELYVLAETGHALHTERPKEVAAKLASFFATAS
ncbi:MAG TPA: alpha/beta fold hydrolase [Stellaceae bacterium]|nr:alpha/beta fold hydrolase [Stellaceae bacterium]